MGQPKREWGWGESWQGEGVGGCNEGRGCGGQIHEVELGGMKNNGGHTA